MTEGVSHRQQDLAPRGLAAMMRWTAIAGAMLVSACASGPRIIPETQRPPVVEPVRRPEPVRPVQPGIPEDQLRHRIALLVPLSGANGGVGRSLANATQLALLDSQSEKIRITNYDTATGAAAATQRAIADGNQLILGPLLADDVRTVAPIARRAGIPVLSFSNDVSVAGGGVFVMGYTPSESIARVVNYARQAGITQFAGLIPTGLYGERASTAFLRSVEANGGAVVTLQTYDHSAGSVTAAVTRLLKSPFQAVLIADGGPNAAGAVTVLRKSPAGVGAHVLGTELWNSDSAIGATPALVGAWFASVPDAYYRSFTAKYRGRFGVAPYRLSTLGYDSVLLTVRIAANWAPGTPFPVARLVDREGFSGVDGVFRFGRDGIAERGLEVQEVHSGGAVTVSPAPSGFGQ